MEKIKTVLVDDEQNSREVLRELLTNFFPDIEILGEAENVEQAFSLINTQKPHIVFLDIEMPRASGFSLLKKFEAYDFEVIFVTSYDHYAIDAIKFSALDYLLKPVETNDLKNSILRARKRIETKKKNAAQIINLFNNLEADIQDRQIAVHVGENVKLISTRNILYIEGDGRYSNIICEPNERFVISRNLKEFETYFGENSGFVRIHKCCIINIKHISEYSKGEPCFMTMRNNAVFEVSRRKKQEVLEKLKK